MLKEDYKEILRTTLKDSWGHYGFVRGKYIFQHDNDPKHTARPPQAYLKDSGIGVLPWPAQSPDLSPIERIWGHLKVQIGRREKRPTSVHELWEVIMEEWEKMPQPFIDNLYESMPKRVRAVVSAKEGHIEY